MRNDDSSIGKWKLLSECPVVRGIILFRQESKKFAFLQTPKGLSTRGLDHLLPLMFKAAVQILLQQSATESIIARES